MVCASRQLSLTLTIAATNEVYGTKNAEAVLVYTELLPLKV
jgi:hypothetical protein